MPKFLHPTEVLSDQPQPADNPELLDLLLRSERFHLKIEGFSMYPSLRKGDLVEVTPLSRKGPRLGDIVVFQREDRFVCHRLVEIFDKEGKKWARTKGDAARGLDRPISFTEILGGISRIERNGRSWTPSTIPQKATVKESFLFFMKKQLGDHIRAVLRTLFLHSQSYRPFRLVYRSSIHPKLIHSIAISTSSVPDLNAYRFFAKRKNWVIGSLEIKSTKEAEWELSHLFVRPRCRGQGIATTLLKKGFQTLRRREIRVLKVKVNPQNRPALALFRNLDFAPSPEEPTLLQREFPFPMKYLDKEKELQPFFYDSFSTCLSLDRIERLKGSFIQSGAQQLFFEQALFEIGEVFGKKGIPFLVQKGMALAYLLYPDPATRPMVDIDLYLRKRDILRGAACLKELGYEMGRPDFTEELLTFGGELSFYRKKGPLVELHWHLEQYERLKGIITIDERALWEKAIPYEISGKKFYTFCPEHQLLSLAIHLGLVHRFQGLKWFLDIDRWVLTFGGDVQWEEIFQTAKDWGIKRLLCQVLLETERLFNTPLPPLSARRRPSFLKSTAFQWLLLDRPQDSLRVLLRMAFPSREWLIYRYRLEKRERVFCFRLLHPFLLLLGKTR